MSNTVRVLGMDDSSLEAIWMFIEDEVNGNPAELKTITGRLTYSLLRKELKRNFFVEEIRHLQEYLAGMMIGDSVTAPSVEIRRAFFSWFDLEPDTQLKVK